MTRTCGNSLVRDREEMTDCGAGQKNYWGPGACLLYDESTTPVKIYASFIKIVALSIYSAHASFRSPNSFSAF